MRPLDPSGLAQEMDLLTLPASTRPGPAMAKAKSKSATKAKPVAKKKAAKPAPKDRKPVASKKAAPPAKKPQKKGPLPVKKSVAKPVSKKPAPRKPEPKKAAPAKPVVKAQPEKAAAKPAPPTAATKATVKQPAVKPAPATVVKEQPAAKAAPSKPTKAAKVNQPIIAVMAGVEPIGGPAKVLKRAAKERFSMEFYLRATPGSLYDLISTPSGFSEWFCDDVDVRGDMFTFRWGSDVQVAECLGRKAGELMRFQWVNEDDAGAWFELRIRIDPMTNETCLVVTDHAWPKDLEEAKALWGSQIHTLQRVLGA